MTIAVRNLLARASVLLKDEQNVRWPREELLSWANDAQRAIVTALPHAFILRNDNFTVTSGPYHTLPTRAIELVGIEYIRSKTSSVRLAARRVDKSTLDAMVPGWQSTYGDTETYNGSVNYVYDTRQPLIFYTYPSFSTGTTASLTFTAVPDELDFNSDLQLDDIYINPMLDYILFRSYLKEEEEVAIDQTKAFAHKAEFERALGIKVEGYSEFRSRDVRQQQ